MPSEKRFIEVKIESWRDFVAVAENTSGFMFRGQSNEEWRLTTTLERIDTRFGLSPFNSEYWALDEFKSKYHLYASGPKPIEDNFEWLALMQHHGCPTRLLDFTHSIYIALHFAVTHAYKNAAVWAINRWQVRDNIHRSFDSAHSTGSFLKDQVNKEFIALFNSFELRESAKPQIPAVMPLESTKMSARVARQQALFLAPTTTGKIGEKITFEACLNASFGHKSESRIQLSTLSLNEYLKSDSL